VLSYTGDATYDTVLSLAFVFVAVVSVSAWFIASPYGRFDSPKFGLALDPRLGWFLMELPSTLTFVYFFSRGRHRGELVPLLFLGMWLLHYANRGFIFPMLMRVPRGAEASFSLFVVAFGWVATSLHGYLHARFIADLGDHYGRGWLSDPHFLIGAAVYYAAMAGNLHSDAILRRLRSRDEVDSGQRIYRIPTGGLFRFVSSPSYLTELCAWAGFALCTYSLAGLYILTLSAANLLPRALATHRWYRQRFPEYPAGRRALIPFIL
jgi:3-oxo-5-alpha-steroid 4-dehydrogenase 1